MAISGWASLKASISVCMAPCGSPPLGMYHILRLTADWAEVVRVAGPRSTAKQRRAGPTARGKRGRAKRVIGSIIPLETELAFESALKDGLSVDRSITSVKPWKANLGAFP